MATRQSNASAELERLRRRVRELEGQLRENNAESKELSPQQATLDGNRAQKTTANLDDNTLLGSLLYHLEDGVIVVNAEGDLILFNSSARRIIGIAPVTGGDKWTTSYQCFRPDLSTPFPPKELPLSRALRGETVRDELVFVTNALIPEGVLVNVAAMTLRDERSCITGAMVIFHDVTLTHQQQTELDRRNEDLAIANLEIKTQQTLLENILESIDIGITVANNSGEFTVFNTAARRLLGVGPVAGVANWTPEYGCFRMNGAPCPANELPLARALNGETVHGDMLYVYNPQTDNKILLRVSAAPIVNPPVDIKGALCLFYDITGEQETKALFENVLENIEIAVTLVNASGKFVLFNSAARQLLGVGPVDGTELWSSEYGIFHLNDQSYAEEELPIARALKGEYVLDEVLKIYNPEKEKHCILSVTAAPFNNPASNFKGALCFAYDITETTEAQQQVALGEARFRAFMNNLPAVAFIKDAEGHYLYGNDEFYR
ncbi:MAG: PAS domain-containing protein, partial [Planctomycetota bacterium]|nr:PAS domain-containing protein [Planctomycetota bacterium]